MHPKEARKQKTGTGRLCHLALKNSRLHVGIDFTEDPVVGALIEDNEYTSALLFPSPGAINLSQGGFQSTSGFRKKLQIFIVDGTWPLAGKILRLSKNLRALPAVSFTPRQPSGYQFKKQPRADYLSTLESIQLLLELGREQGVESSCLDLGQLPTIFERLVQIQLQTAGESTSNRSI